jgi:hypothetical protein
LGALTLMLASRRILAVVFCLCFWAGRLAAAPDGSVRDVAANHWDRVPLALHFAKRTAPMTAEELDFVASHSQLVTLEKGHGARSFGSTEAGIAATARELKQRNPKLRVLFYFNALVNWQGYDAFKSYSTEWDLRDSAGARVNHPSGQTRPDPSNPEWRKWWVQSAVHGVREGKLDGVFVDALPQALSPTGLRERLGAERAAAVVDGLRKLLAELKQALGSESVVLVNGTRGESYRELLDWDGVDGVMIEHFAAFESKSAADIRADLETLTQAEAKGRFVVLKAWPSFTWLDRERRKQPMTALLAQARADLDFPLACFLIGAARSSYFCYSWGYTHEHGMLTPYAEFEQKLGSPVGPATWDGLRATREFAHARVAIDLEQRTARIEWR